VAMGAKQIMLTNTTKGNLKLIIYYDFEVSNYLSDYENQDAKYSLLSGY
jgi:hypothetical protein